MSKPLNTPYTVHVPGPIDTRTQVETYAGLANIAIKYEGLKVYVKADNKEYRYYSTGWVEWTSGGSSGGGAWGSITGDINDQTDLITALGLKFAKAGGTITGPVVVQSTVEASNFLIVGSAPTEEFPYVQSTITGEPAGSSVVQNIVFISSADHAQAVIDGTLVAGTHYLIT